MLKEKIVKFAKEELGFDLIAFTGPKLAPKYLDAYKNWLKQGLHADMHYMEKSAPRLNPRQILANCETVIVLALNYYHDQPAPASLPAKTGLVARYAYGRDYHKIIGKKLRLFEKFINSLAPTSSTKAYVDTGPVLEHAYAEQSGIGVIGKNSLLITREYGSWVFIATLFTDLPLAPDKPLANTNFSACGACRRCIDACPTGAIIAPGVIDSRRCISYLTIENKGQIPPEFAAIIKQVKRIYGCDICQEVCPHNSPAKSKPASCTELKNPPIAGNTLVAAKIRRISTRDQFIQTFAGSPLTRAKLHGIKRNVEILN